MTKEISIKISYQFSLPYKAKCRSKKPPKQDRCKLCGAILTDPKSLKVGYGHKCFNKIPLIIVLDIPGEPPEEK